MEKKVKVEENKKQMTVPSVKSKPKAKKGESKREQK